MNPDKILIAVAKLDGWTETVYSNFPRQMMRKEEVDKLEPKTGICPDYITSRDAIIPVIEKQPPAVLAEVCRQLLVILKDYWTQIDKEVDWTSQIMCMMATLQATPLQLCTALLKATGKWEDGE